MRQRQNACAGSSERSDWCVCVCTGRDEARCGLLSVLNVFGLNPEDFGFSIDEVAQIADVFRRLQLVAGNHPHMDPGGSQVFQRVSDALLQRVLQRGYANQLQTSLHLVLQLFMFVCNICGYLRFLHFVSIYTCIYALI